MTYKLAYCKLQIYRLWIKIENLCEFLRMLLIYTLLFESWNILLYCAFANSNWPQYDYWFSSLLKYLAVSPKRIQLRLYTIYINRRKDVENSAPLGSSFNFFKRDFGIFTLFDQLSWMILFSHVRHLTSFLCYFVCKWSTRNVTVSLGRYFHL